MTQPPTALIPRPGDRGLGTTDRAALIASVAQSWALFATMIDDLDLDAPTRAKGLIAREVLIPLGAWDDNRPLSHLLDDVRRGVVGVHDQGALVEAVRAAHRHESDDAIRDAIRRQGEEMETFLFSDQLDDVAAAPIASMLGTLPLITFLHAATYPLATSALDLEQCGAVVPDGLLDNALRGLVDTIGALAARAGLTASIAAITPTTLVGTASQDGSWRTALIDPASLGDELPGAVGPSIRGSSRLLLDVTAGRADIPGAARRGELGLHDVAGLMALAPVVESVPGIPGRSALMAAIRATTALGSAASAVSAALRLLPFGRSGPS